MDVPDGAVKTAGSVPSRAITIPEQKEYDVMDVDSFVKACHVNEENGAHRFSIVTAGRTLVGKEFDQIVEAYKRMHEECKEIELCASHGLLTKRAV